MDTHPQRLIYLLLKRDYMAGAICLQEVQKFTEWKIDVYKMSAVPLAALTSNLQAGGEEKGAQATLGLRNVLMSFHVRV